jgi:hypothetical protein
MKATEGDKVLQAIHDLTRVIIACDDQITSKSEAVRRLHLAAIPQARIASLLSMPTKDVTSIVSRIKKSNGGRKESRRG